MSAGFVSFLALPVVLLTLATPAWSQEHSGFAKKGVTPAWTEGAPSNSVMTARSIAAHSWGKPGTRRSRRSTWTGDSFLPRVAASSRTCWLAAASHSESHAGPGGVQCIRCGTLVFMTTSTAARPGRNEFCRCGSGRKYKHCCLAKDDKQAAAARATSLADAPAQSSEDVTSISKPAPRPRTDQPWKGSATRGFVPRSRTPRKVGGG